MDVIRFGASLFIDRYVYSEWGVERVLRIFFLVYSVLYSFLLQRGERESFKVLYMRHLFFSDQYQSQ